MHCVPRNCCMSVAVTSLTVRVTRASVRCAFAFPSPFRVSRVSIAACAKSAAYVTAQCAVTYAAPRVFSGRTVVFIPPEIPFSCVRDTLGLRRAYKLNGSEVFGFLPEHERMASSPEFIRLATSSSRTLPDTALDSLCDAVVIVDARHKHFPVVLANAAARCCLIEESDTFGLIESPLYHWLAPESVAAVGASLAALPDHRSATRRTLEWRCAAGEVSVMTDIRPLVSAPGHRLIIARLLAALLSGDVRQVRFPS